MTRSEEDLRVGTTERESGRARLRKYVIVDEVAATVPVKREEIRWQRLATDVESADLSGVTGRPTFFVNGHRHYGPYDTGMDHGCTGVAARRSLRSAPRTHAGR